MRQLDVSIRAPTGIGWVLSLTLLVISGEIAREIQAGPVVTLFGQAMASSDLWPVFFAFVAGASMSILWLLSLYLKPGRLKIFQTNASAEAKTFILRQKGALLNPKVVEAPVSQWSATLVFFSEKERLRGAFKRLVLTGPEWEEVLFFTDLKEGEKLVLALEAIEEELKGFEVHIENQRFEVADVSPDQQAADP